jgi:hypothetical protein
MQMPITMDNTHAVISSSYSCPLTVPLAKKASGAIWLLVPFCLDWKASWKDAFYSNQNLANSVRIEIMDLLGTPSVLLSSPCPFLGRAVTRERVSAQSKADLTGAD